MSGLLDGRLSVVERRGERPVGRQVEHPVEQPVERRVEGPAAGIWLYGKLSLLWLWGANNCMDTFC